LETEAAANLQFLYMSNPRRLLLLLFILLAPPLATIGYLVAEEDYVIYDGETRLTIAGQYETVAEVIAAAGITLRPEDMITPTLINAAETGTAIHIQRAYPVTLRTEQGSQILWTQQTTLGGFLAEAGIFVQATTPLAADGVPVGIGQLADVPLPALVEIGRFHTITIYDGNQRQTLRTAVTTVAAALQEAGISFDANRVDPPPASPLKPGMIINVQHSLLFTIQVDGRILQTHSHQTDPHVILAEEGITLHGDDYTIPGPDTALRANESIQVIRVTEDFRLEDEAIPYQTLWQASDDLDLDTQEIITPGVPGVLRRRLRLRYENGVEVSQTLDGEWIEREPANEIIGYGTRITVRTVETPEGLLSYWRLVRMRVTSYTAASSGRELDDPAYGITASGYGVARGMVAVDRSVVPFRSFVYVPNYGIGYVGDTGGGVRGRWIDLGYQEHDFVPWSGYVDVYYLTPVPKPEDINYLLPTVLP
jgi:uncharacterized protein YabE (DUF348 family)